MSNQNVWCITFDCGSALTNKSWSGYRTGYTLIAEQNAFQCAAASSDYLLNMAMTFGGVWQIEDKRGVVIAQSKGWEK